MSAVYAMVTVTGVMVTVAAWLQPRHAVHMEDWAAALIAGLVQLLLALFLRHRPVSLVRCVRHAFKLRRSLKSRVVRRPTQHHARHYRNSARANATRSTAQRHWDVLRRHVFEQGLAERSKEAHYEQRYQETHFGRRHRLSNSFKKTVQDRLYYHTKAQADDQQQFITAFKDSQARHMQSRCYSRYW